LKKQGKCKDGLPSKLDLTVEEYLGRGAKKFMPTDFEIESTPFWKDMQARQLLLETLKELHSGDLFAVLRLQDIANRLTEKAGKKFSALKVSAMIREIFGDYVIEKHKSRYFAAIQIDRLNQALERYGLFKI